MLPDRGDGSVEAIDSVLTWNLIGSIDCDQRELYGKWQSSRNGREPNVGSKTNDDSGPNVGCGPPGRRESGVGRQARFLWPGTGEGRSARPLWPQAGGRPGCGPNVGSGSDVGNGSDVGGI